MFFIRLLAVFMVILTISNRVKSQDNDDEGFIASTSTVVNDDESFISTEKSIDDDEGFVSTGKINDNDDESFIANARPVDKKDNGFGSTENVNDEESFLSTGKIYDKGLVSTGKIYDDDEGFVSTLKSLNDNKNFIANAKPVDKNDKDLVSYVENIDDDEGFISKAKIDDDDDESFIKNTGTEKKGDESFIPDGKNTKPKFDDGEDSKDDEKEFQSSESEKMTNPSIDLAEDDESEFIRHSSSKTKSKDFNANLKPKISDKYFESIDDSEDDENKFKPKNYEDYFETKDFSEDDERGFVSSRHNRGRDFKANLGRKETNKKALEDTTGPTGPVFTGTVRQMSMKTDEPYQTDTSQLETTTKPDISRVVCNKSIAYVALRKCKWAYKYETLSDTIWDKETFCCSANDYLSCVSSVVSNLGCKFDLDEKLLFSLIQDSMKQLSCGTYSKSLCLGIKNSSNLIMSGRRASGIIFTFFFKLRTFLMPLN